MLQNFYFNFTVVELLFNIYYKVAMSLRADIFFNLFYFQFSYDGITIFHLVMVLLYFEIIILY